MTDEFSQIDIYEKGKEQNALPIGIQFDFTQTNFDKKYSNTTVCEFINNNASGLDLRLIKDKKEKFC